MSKVSFLDLKTQYEGIASEVEPKVLDILRNCAYIGGSYVEDFERNVAAFLGVKHAIGCSNGTDALVLGLKACGINPGDEVITTPFSFFATAEAIASIGAIPVFVDICESDYNIDPALIEDAITDKTKAILPVHIFGAPCDMDLIRQVADRHGLRVIEDDAQAIGSEYKGRKSGTLGNVGCFSFYPTKNLGGAGDGGMVTTNDDDVATLLKAYKVHGAGKVGAEAKQIIGDMTGMTECAPVSKEVATDLYDPYKYYNYLIGYNSRLDAIQAAVLSVKLKHLDEYNNRRRNIARRYYEGLTDKVILPQYSDDVKPCWHQFVLRSTHKQRLCEYLAAHDVGVGTFYPVPLHKQKAFDTSNCGNPGASLPIAEMIASQSVCLPIFPEMTDDQVQYVIDTVNGFYENE